MRIIVVNVHFAPATFGGATVIAEQTAEGLARLGHEVVVFTGTTDPSLAPGELLRYEWRGIPVIAVRMQQDPEDESRGYDGGGVPALFDEAVRALAPDVIHVHSVQYLGAGIVEVAQRHAPTVVTLHDAWWLCERQFMVRSTGEDCGQTAIDAAVCATCVGDAERHRRRQRRSLDLLNSCARVLAPSRTWASIMSASGIDGGLVHVNANGVRYPSPGFTRPDYAGPLRLGFVGGVAPEKGYDLIVAALRLLRRSDYELHVADAGMTLTGRQTISQRAWPVSGLVRIIPGYTQDSMDDFLGRIDVLLAPSVMREPYGLTVREGLLRGVWPIGSAGGALGEVIVDGVNGTLVDRSIDSLASAIGSLLDAPRTPPAGDWGIPSIDDQTRDLASHLHAVAAR